MHLLQPKFVNGEPRGNFRAAAGWGSKRHPNSEIRVPRAQDICSCNRKEAGQGVLGFDGGNRCIERLAIKCIEHASEIACFQESKAVAASGNVSCTVSPWMFSSILPYVILGCLRVCVAFVWFVLLVCCFFSQCFHVGLCAKTRATLADLSSSKPRRLRTRRARRSRRMTKMLVKAFLILFLIHNSTCVFLHGSQPVDTLPRPPGGLTLFHSEPEQRQLLHANVTVPSAELLTSNYCF